MAPTSTFVPSRSAHGPFLPYSGPTSFNPAAAAGPGTHGRPGDTGRQGITENTLIRLAIDLLIANVSQLHGSTEGELRRSLGLGD